MWNRLRVRLRCSINVYFKKVLQLHTKCLMLSFELRTEFLAALFNCPIETGCMIKIGNYIILNEILNPQKRQILIRILHCELSSFPPSFFLSPLLNTTCNTPRLNKKYLLLLSLQKKIGQKKKIKPNGEQKTNSRIEKESVHMVSVHYYSTI